MKTTAKLWLALAVLVVLSPLGLVIAAAAGAGTAWGEWSIEEVHRLVGYVPAKMERLSRVWRAPLPDYTLPGAGPARLPSLSVSYALSAVVGVAAVVAVTILLGRLLARREDDHADAA